MKTRLDQLLAFVLCVFALTYCTAPTLAQCPNDLCTDAVTIDCQPTAFDNYDCTIYDFQNSGMSRLVGNCNNSNMSNCGGNDYTSVHTDLWFGTYLEAGWYDLSVFTDYSCTVCSPSGTKGVSMFVWYTAGSCEDAVISYARNCPGAACWSGNIGEVVGEVAEYGPQDHSLTIEFLSSGQYYIQVQAWGWGPNHPDFLDYSKGSGTISICPTTPLSTKPELFYRNSRLEWIGTTQNDWTVFQLIDLNWTEIARIPNRQLEIKQSGYYIVAGSSGFSNPVRVEFSGRDKFWGFNVIGQETDKMIVK